MSREISFSSVSETSFERLSPNSIVVIAPVDPMQKIVTVPVLIFYFLTSSEITLVISTIPQSSFPVTEISLVSTGVKR
ncbi:hypothetical protein [Methanosarcina sp. UBA5]|uniref:hypothetical protein n=1 Tax=Methanosarcina sp. UBA5 TaxID=1915593 RepID=UPI0025D47E10|nr:hypothetical protein [Methanosarcina sp. UBA5]